MPPMPSGVEEGIIKGLYLYRACTQERSHRAQIFASGTAMQAALEAQHLLTTHHDVAADVWSATSYKLLREDALSVERWNRLHPSEPQSASYLANALDGVDGPIVAVTDFMKAVPDQIGRFTAQSFTSLGTDGYGHSDTRATLRRHFETDAGHIVTAVLASLAACGDIKDEKVAAAIRRYEIDTDAADPREA